MATASTGKEKTRIQEILARLDEKYPAAECALQHRNPFELLMATILSAQCTDVRVNKVTPGLFSRYPDASAMARADENELQDLIRSTGFFRNKSRSLIGASEKIVDEFNGKVPRTMEKLLQLPGVARKTANVVLGTGFGISEGVVVDTHVRRLSQRLGLTQEKAPEKIEQDLMEKLPRERWITFSHQLIHHGRQICKSQRPRCDDCFLPDVCPFYQKLT